MIKKADYSLQDEGWNEVSDDAKDLVKKLLIVDSEKRLSAEGIL